jgi:hypothetical protein
MNAPNDPLFQSLADEAADLPVRAASAARQRNIQRRQNRQRLVLATVLSLFGVIAWNFVVTKSEPFTTIALHSPGVTTPELSPEPDSPIAQPFETFENPSPREGSVSVTLPLPSGLDSEQAKFVEAVGDVPLLFVRDDSGKVTRIHIVHR